MFNKKRLADYMKAHGLTNVALAKRLGISEGAVRHILVGAQQPSLAILVDLTQMIGCSVSELVIIPEGE